MNERKPIGDDPGVKAAIGALRTAILAVNGDDSVKSIIVYADVLQGEQYREPGQQTGSTVCNIDFCGCDDCCIRAYEVIKTVLLEANEHFKAEEAAGEPTQH